MRFLIANLFCFIFISSALAEQSQVGGGFSNQAKRAAIPEDLGVVDELVESDIDPERVYLLTEVETGVVKQYDSWFIDHNEELDIQPQVGSSGLKHWQVGTVVQLESQSKNLSYSFFLADSESAFAATPVKTLSFAELRENSKAVVQLIVDVEQLKLDLHQQVAVLEKVEEELDGLRRKASQIAGIENIVDLKMELSQIEGFGSEFSSEKRRLEDLIKIGRSLPESPGLTVIRKDLGEQLREAAKLTAMADRLAARKHKAAVSRLRSKIAAVKAAKGVDPRLISRQVVKLRRKRRELENRLGKSGVVANQREF